MASAGVGFLAKIPIPLMRHLSRLSGFGRIKAFEGGAAWMVSFQQTERSIEPICAATLLTYGWASPASGVHNCSTSDNVGDIFGCF